MLLRLGFSPDFLSFVTLKGAAGDQDVSLLSGPVLLPPHTCFSVLVCPSGLEPEQFFT